MNAISKTVAKSTAGIIFCRHFAAFFAAFQIFCYFIRPLAISVVESKDFASIILTYNALVLSLSLASMTLVIAIPSQAFIQFLAEERKINSKIINPFQNLILSFYQCAAAHYFSLLLVVFIYIFAGNTITLQNLFNYESFYSYFFVVQAWSIVLFGFALWDIANLGVLYANFLAKNGISPKGNSNI
ncbi:hypothetical protein ACVFYP_10215 [Roseomonas sp. F4]